MKFIYFFTLTVILLTSCSIAPYKGTELTATPLIKIAQSTSNITLEPKTILPYEISGTTPTPIDISGLDLKLILNQLGEPPSGITTTLITDTLPSIYNGIEQPLKQIFQEFLRNDQSVGGIAILVSDTISDATANYAIILQHMGWKGNTVEVKSLGNIIEEARASPPGTVMAGGISVMDLVFQRCNVVVQIQITGEIDRDSVISYAKKLDKILIPLVCP